MKRAYQIAVVVIAVLSLGGMLIYLLPSNVTGKTIEQAIEKSGRRVEKVIYEEKVKGGEVVFYYQSNNAGTGSTMASGYIKKTLWGLEWVYGGGHTHSGLGQPITEQYFPSTKDTPFPLAFGEISDSQIVRVRIQTENGTTGKEASIVEDGTTKIWYVFLHPSDGPLTKVDGLGQGGQILASKELSQSTIETIETSDKKIVDVSEVFKIIPNTKFYVLLDEYLDNNDKHNPKANISVLVREYRCYDDTTEHGTSTYESTNKIVMPKTDNILALKNSIKPDSLKLLPNTIVSKKIINQWIEEGYEPQFEYYDMSQKGLTYSDLRP